MADTKAENNPAPFTVTELTKKVKKHLEELGTVWVVGEISNLKYPSSGHIFLTLKDKEHQVGAIVWRNVAKSFPLPLKDGLEVLVSGEISAYQGQYRITVHSLEPRGLGALLVAFDNLKKKLAGVGLFDAAHKKALPVLPRKICIVTSPSGAVVQDMLNVIERRFPFVEVLIYPVKVQGDGAAEDVANAIRTINQNPYFVNVDVMIVGRGGGSLEDLWAFNEEVVAYAIYESRIPVISAVGHETDLTISDLVADRRALTPTEAGELVVPRFDQLKHQLATRRKQLLLAINHRVNFYRSYLATLATHRAFRRPAEWVRHSRQQLSLLQQKLGSLIERKVQQHHLRLSHISSRLKLQQPSFKQQEYRHKLLAIEKHMTSAINRRMELQKKRLETFDMRLEALSPLSVLQRGYSITHNFAGDAIVRDCDETALGERLWVRLASSWMLVRVENMGKK